MTMEKDMCEKIFYVSNLGKHDQKQLEIDYTIYKSSYKKTTLSLYIYTPKIKNLVIDQEQFSYIQKDGTQGVAKIDCYFISCPNVENIIIENCSSTKLLLYLNEVKALVHITDKLGCDIRANDKMLSYEQKFSSKHEQSDSIQIAFKENPPKISTHRELNLIGDSIRVDIVSSGRLNIKCKKLIGNIKAFYDANIQFCNPVEIHGDIHYACPMEGTEKVTLYGRHFYEGPKPLSDKDLNKVVR